MWDNCTKTKKLLSLDKQFNLFHNYYYMISISGIKNQKELEALECFNKNAASILIGKSGKNLDKKISRLIEMGYLKVLKKGLYVSGLFYEKADKELYAEYLANRLRLPSYLSLEYVLAKEGMIPEAVYMMTSITVKTSRNFTNFIGGFSYRNIKTNLFCGHRTKEWGNKKIYLASKAKALFDYFYLTKMVDFDREIIDLRINWDNFIRKDYAEFGQYVRLAQSKKMSGIFQSLKPYVAG